MKTSSAKVKNGKKAASIETFSYCVGRPWPKGLSNPNGTSISVYAYHTQVQHGTMADAERFRDYVDEQTKKKNLIYKLVPISHRKTRQTPPK